MTSAATGRPSALDARREPGPPPEANAHRRDPSPPAVPPATAAFDRLSSRYDLLCQNEVFAWMRARVHAVCAERFAPGSRVLEIGCGVGLDAAFLAARGVHVTAVDPAPGMVQRAKARLGAQVSPGSVRVYRAGLDTVDDEVSRHDEAGRFDGLLSNFGALNCVSTLDALGPLAARRIAPGSALLICLMGRTCPWEMLYFVGRLDPTGAFRRLHSGATPVKVEGIAVPTTYHTPADVMRALGPGFRLRRLTGLAVMVPPPWLESRWSQVPSPVRRLVSAADVRLSSRFPLNRLGDHFLMDIVRQ